MTVITVPDPSLVLLLGPSGAGKSTFAKKHFAPTEILSSDRCRGLVSDDETDQGATEAAFQVLHLIAEKRLRAGRLTVIDATNVQPEARRPLIELARAQHVLPVAIVLDVAAKLCEERNRARPDRAFGGHVVRQQASQLRRSLRGLAREGLHGVTVLRSPEEIDAATVARQPLHCDERRERGPFDIVGDVHGCKDELVHLLARLGYAGEVPRHPDGRKVVFLGDLVDRGPDSPGVLELVMAMVRDGSALCVAGNHDQKLLRKLDGKNVKLTHGLERTVEQLEARSDAFKREVRELIDGLVSHYVLDEGKLVVAHAGLEESLQGRASGRVRSFALYGETTGEIDAFGLPVRADWARGYRGRAMVVYGHTPTPRAEWVNNTICIDTGCVFGGKLTALRYPERELVSVDAARVYYEPTRPLDAPRVSEDRAGLALSDVSGTRVVHVRHARDVTVHEANATAALEVMSRCAVDPRWLIYLPPTMSPPEASREEGLLEHPKEAFAYFRDAGIVDVVCEEKHMGSRAVIVVCTSADAARARFGVDDGSQGVVYTRTGRPLFRDRALEEEVLQRVAAAGRAAGLFASLGSEWMCLDVEILPWSTKAQERARRQCADIAAAGRAGFGDALGALRRLAEHDPSASMVFDLVAARLPHVEDYERAYRGHAWEVSGLDGYAVAPFHLLASEGRVHVDPRHDHVWHMETLAALCRADSSLLRETRYEAVDLTDEESEARAIAWWTSLTDAGGEGMVVKPRQYLWSDERGLGQPALKCRGREYLRIVYGLEYPEHLERLRRRDVRLERRLAKKQLALGLEALHRFVDREPVSRVHECVFAVLALESEPVDPRP